MQTVSPPKRPRDLRLDFFRGLAMFIIFIAHVPGNPWTNYIPAQFGFSSAAEMFVFCSGLASGLAFGSIFVKRGFFLGLVRVLYRVWQVYWAHIGLCLVICALYFTAAGLTGEDYATRSGLDWLARDPTHALIALLSLRYMPAYLDILPMYILLLSAVPLVMLLAKLHRLLPLGLAILLWGFVQVTAFNLTSGEGSRQLWYFNPFAWQLLFFTGFSFSMRWLPAPRFGYGPLFMLCLAFVILSIPVNFWAFETVFPAQASLRKWLLGDESYAGITDENILRYLHILALAYLALTLIDRHRALLEKPFIRPIVLVGQQSLATFLASLALALGAGVLLDQTGMDWRVALLVNLAGFVALLVTANFVKFFKAKPWTSGVKTVTLAEITKT